MKNPLFLFACFLFPPLAFALPGVQPSIPDLSGQYVYYKDTTFERESYTGILCYDESTYALRYYAPMTNKKQRAKDIQILFSLDPTKNHVDLTGERIITAITPEDTDIVNYLHDSLVYGVEGQRPDVYYVLADFASYVAAQERVAAAYADKKAWAKKALLNIANSGNFSSDRTIEDYVKDIWHLKRVTVDDKELKTSE